MGELEQPFTSAASSSCGLNSSSGSIGSSARGNKRSGGRTFINRRFNKTQLRELLDNPDEQLGHVTGSFGSFSPPQHPPRHKSLSPTPILPLASLQPIGCVPPPPRLSDRMDTFRRQLPTWALREHILRTIEESPVTLITGGTGCGKTTQVPQFLLESAAQRHCPIRILCTQPRRLPAIAVAKRVAIERGERLGTTVGYHIRLESNCSSETVLTYCTSGVLLRKLTADEWANEATHDEIHERETNTDYLLIALRQALKKRKDLKVVLMSATMGDNRAKFMQYFHETGIKCVEVPAQLFSVEVYHLAEALAMTGYMPHSQYGGMFDERAMNLPPPSPLPFYNTFAVPQQQSQCHFVDPFYNSPWRLNSFGPNVPPVQPQMQTVPPDPFISSTTTAGAFASDGFALWRDRRSFPPAVPDIRQKLNIWLMDRPAHFLPHYAPRVREAYLDAGGRQWQDSVDGDLVAELICYLIDCQKEGGILVFLPGYDDIMAVSDRINAMQNEGRFARRVRLYTLHSQINTDRQQNVFERVKNEDWERKVVLSTNIAEASLTIDDIVFVIDCGKAKMKGYDHNTRVSQLKCQPIAKSNAEQRKGRAGRCRPGFCFRLYSHEEFIKMDDNQIPEMMRSAIHEVCLHAKMFAPGNLTVQQFLKLAPDPPADEIVENSLLFLEQLGALYRAPLPVAPPPPPPPDTFLARCPRRPRRGISRFESLGAPVNRRIQLYCPSSFDSLCHWLGVEEASLTELGRTIAHLPLEPQPARLLLFGIALRCVGPVLTLVAALSHRDPFVLAVNEDQKQKANTIKDEFSLMDFSDHLMLIRAFNAYQRVYGGYREQWCWDRMLSESGMRMIGGIRHQLFVELRRLRLLPSQMSNADDDVNGLNLFSVSWPMVQGCIVAGTYPNIGFVRLGTKLNRIRTV
uniref:RNA helicase n=1 Tax=Globodera pallida TaxID=36090 RepID=A0A183BVC1_GLOPA